MCNLPLIFPRSWNMLLTVQSCGDSLEIPKPPAIFTFLAMLCNFGLAACNVLVLLGGKKSWLPQKVIFMLI